MPVLPGWTARLRPIRRPVYRIYELGQQNRTADRASVEFLQSMPELLKHFIGYARVKCGSQD
ncbi:MAG: hypothetical protein WBI38_07485, partial [Bacillota bacterium]